MRKYITKRVRFTKISTKEIVIENGDVTGKPLDDFTVTGSYDKDRAYKVAKKQYKGKNVVVTDTKVFELTYRMETEKFLQMAEEVEENTEVNE